MREAAQAKLKALKKKGRDDKNCGEVEDENGAQKNQRKGRVNDSPEKVASDAKKLLNGNKARPATDVVSGSKQPTTASSKKARGTSPLSGAATRAVGKKSDVATAESTIAGKNFAELESSKKPIPPLAGPKQSKQTNGKSLPNLTRQATGEKAADNKAAAPNSPKEDFSKNLQLQSQNGAQITQENARATTGNAPAPVGTLPNTSEAMVGGKPATQKPASGVSKIPSAIEFDPLKTAPTSEINLSLDANGGRSTPVDAQSEASSNAAGGISSADAGLGNGSFSNYNQYSQPFDVAAGLLGRSGMAVPVLGIAPATGHLNYQQSNGAYHQGAAMMHAAQQSFSQPPNETASTAMPSNISVLQQPFLQVSDVQSLQSMPGADLSQPMILIQPQHVRGVTMHDFSPDAMLRGAAENVSPSNQGHHSRGNSLHTFPNPNPAWNQNSQWSPMPSNGMGQQQQAPVQQLVPPSDPFDELVSRRPMSAMPSNGK